MSLIVGTLNMLKNRDLILLFLNPVGIGEVRPHPVDNRQRLRHLPRRRQAPRQFHRRGQRRHPRRGRRPGGCRSVRRGLGLGGVLARVCSFRARDFRIHSFPGGLGFRPGISAVAVFAGALPSGLVAFFSAAGQAPARIRAVRRPPGIGIFPLWFFLTLKSFTAVFLTP